VLHPEALITARWETAAEQAELSGAPLTNAIRDANIQQFMDAYKDGYGTWRGTVNTRCQPPGDPQRVSQPMTLQRLLPKMQIGLFTVPRQVLGNNICRSRD
jgi:hypothetical protein